MPCPWDAWAAILFMRSLNPSIVLFEEVLVVVRSGCVVKPFYARNA